MADTTKQLILKIQADLENYNANIEKVIAQTNKLDSSFGQTAKGAENLWQKFMIGSLAASVVTKVFSEIKSFTTGSTKAFLEEEESTRRLTIALKLAGDGSQKTLEHFEGLTKNLMQTTLITDEEARNMMQLGLSMGIPIKNIEAVTKGAIGLNEALGIGMDRAMRGIANAMEGEFGQLERFIPALRSAQTETEKMAVLQKIMADGFSMAEDATQIAGGQMAQMGKELEELQEDIGKVLVETFLPVLKDLNKWVQDNKEGIIIFFETLASTVKSLGETVYDFSAALGKLASLPFGGILGEPGLNIGDLKQQLQELKSMREGKIWKLSLDDEGIKRYNIAVKSLEKQIAYLENQEKKYTQTLKVSNEIKEKGIGINLKINNTHEETIKELKLITNQWEAFDEIQKISNKHMEDFYIPTKKVSEVMKEIEQEFVKSTFKDFNKGIEKIDDNIVKVEKKTKEWTMDWRDANDVIQFTNSCIGELGNLLESLGIDLGNTGEEILNLAGDMGTLAASIATQNIPGIVSGAISVLGDFINLFKGDGIKEAIRRENEWMDLTKEQIERLHKLAEELGDTHAATSEMLSEFIRDAEITGDNFDEWSSRIHEILSDFDRGKLKGKEFADAMGSAWDALTEKMKELKMPGITGGMASIIQDLRARGMEVKAISDFVMQSLTTGVSALGGYFKGAKTQDEFNRGLTYTMGLFKALQSEGKSFNEIMDLMGDQFDTLLEKMTEGFTATGGISDLLKMRQFAKDNAGLMDQISSLTTLMKSFGDSVYMDQELFANFGASTLDVYNKLIGAGQSEKEALQWIAPLLAEQLWYAKQYNYTLDEKTQAMIDAAKAEGINLEGMKTEKELLSSINDALWEMVKLFGGDIPNAIGVSISALDNLAGSAAGAVGAMAGMGPPSKNEPGDGTIPAQEGLHAVIRGPRKIAIERGVIEQVDITPINRPGNRGGGGGSISVPMYLTTNIYGSILDKDAWEKVGKIVFQDNYRTWTTELKKVLGL